MTLTLHPQLVVSQIYNLMHTLIFQCPLPVIKDEYGCVYNAFEQQLCSIPTMFDKLTNGNWSAVVEPDSTGLKYLESFPKIGAVEDVKLEYPFAFRSTRGFEDVDVFHCV